MYILWLSAIGAVWHANIRCVSIAALFIHVLKYHINKGWCQWHFFFKIKVFICTKTLTLLEAFFAFAFEKGLACMMGDGNTFFKYFLIVNSHDWSAVERERGKKKLFRISLSSSLDSLKHGQYKLVWKNWIKFLKPSLYFSLICGQVKWFCSLFFLVFLVVGKQPVLFLTSTSSTLFIIAVHNISYTATLW